MKKLSHLILLIILINQSMAIKRLKKDCFYQNPIKERNKTIATTKPTTTTTSPNTIKIINSTLLTTIIPAAADRALNQSGTNPSNVMAVFNSRNLTQLQLGELRTLLVGSCWRDSYPRGAGESITECASDEDKDGSLCYPKCQKGYSGVGPVCWETCKDGFTDRGVFCIQDLLVIGKGCCCIGNNSCCNNCPLNFTDDGCTCRRVPVSYAKKSYGRGAGTPLKCKPNYDLDGALCYPTCLNGWSGAGPVCWKNCIEPLINDCGGMCTISESVCAYKSFSLVYVLGFPFKNMLYWIAGPIAFLDLTTLTDIPVGYSIPKCY